VSTTHDSLSARQLRLIDELAETGLPLDATDADDVLLLIEVDYALRPPIHERRVPSVGSIIEPTVDPDQWDERTHLEITHRPIGRLHLEGARRFADGFSSWVIRRASGEDEWAVFDRPAGSERDLVVLADALGASIVQRHPTGAVRVIGAFGVLRCERYRWHHEPPLRAWIDSIAACPEHGDRDVLETLLRFAVHDLGSRGIGAILVYRPDNDGGQSFETRMPAPPPLQIRSPAALAPLRHALAQVDGAAVIDANGQLRELGVRLVPSPQAEAEVAGYRGMRHTSGRRYSYDDPLATVIVVSEDGPVTVLRNGELLGVSAPD
jgi:DNA integrity scanning protein DisA with diadenylate cyclase activity